MGAGMWSASSYAATTGAKIRDGRTFGYTDSARSTGSYIPHESLDPKKVAKNGVIESRDNSDHPNSVPIFIGFDQTGSMGSIPGTLQKKLAGIFDLLMLRGYVEDPQIAIGAYGDCYRDPVRSAVQFSNFESDNRIDEALDNILVYGGGGANGGETMSGLWYMLDKVVTDSMEKRNKKGYAFFIADEISYDLLPEHVSEFAGDGEPTSPLQVNELAKKIQEGWEVYILLIDNMSAQMQGSEKFYTDIFGISNVLVLEDPEAVSETIALTIGVREGTVDIDDAKDDMSATGSNEVAIRNSVTAVRNAGLANLSKGAMANVNADVVSRGGGAERL